MNPPPPRRPATPVAPPRPPSPKAEAAFMAALDHEPEGRDAFVAEACEGDEALAAEVRALLALHRKAGDFLEEPPITSEAEAEFARLKREDEGERIGRYKLLQEIGEGGFGVVWMAEQMEPVSRRVALKIIKLGMDTREVIARFEAERQALAMMDHPNIAKVFDAGATDKGRPFFVMELVRGIPITRYCDEVGLGTRERLALFGDVCSAINHAHQKGVIHRDIKPSNVMITLHGDKPVVKVIDFGIAKATQGKLTDKTLFTRFEQFVGTPVYMSPEQASMSGLDVDTRSDIYALGILLYELLTGKPPFDAHTLASAGYAEMRRIIREVEPPKPSSRISTMAGEERTVVAKARHMEPEKLSRLVAADLDWIVMKAIDKDRTRRYETANGLARDIQRFLADETVSATPPSAGYRFHKFARRNRAVIRVVASIGAVLVAATLVSTWQAVRATRARKAEIRQRMAAEDAQAHAVAQQKKAEAQQQRADAERQRAEEQLKRAEGLVYASKLMLAQTDFEAGNGGLALHYLAECQENLRGWEHRYLSTRINAKQTLLGHTSEVSSVAFSPDGQRIVTGSYDQSAKVWDAATGREILALKGHSGYMLSVAFSPDGQRILTGGGEWGEGKKPGEVKVWDAGTGKAILDLKGHDYCVWSVAFSPDGQRVVSGAGDWGSGPGEVKVWDAVTGQELLSVHGHMHAVRSVAFSPDGRSIVTGSEDHSTKMWDAETGQEIFALKGHRGAVRGVAFSLDGKRIVTGSTDFTAKVWDAGTGQEVLTLRHASYVLSVAFSADGKRIVTGSADPTTKVWDAATGVEVFTLKGHANSVRSVAFSPDGKRILTGSNDRTAKVWDAENGQEIPTLKGHRDFVSSIAFSPDGKRFVTGSGDGRAKVWDAATGRELLSLNEATTGSWRVVGVWGVAFSPDGQRIVTGSNDQTAKVWDAATGRELFVLKHLGVVSSVAFSPDGKRILTGVGEWGHPPKKPGGAKVWDAAIGRELLNIEHSYAVRSVAFSPDGQRMVTGSGDQIVRVWDAATGRELLTLKGHTDAIHSVAFSPDGKRILTGSQDKTAKVWDAATGQEILTLQGHTAAVHCVAFSPDGQRIVTGSDDESAKVWNVATGQEVFALKGHGAVWSVAFSPDGNRIVTGIAGANATVKVWSAAPQRQLAPEKQEKTGVE